MDSPRKQRITSSPPPVAGRKRSASSLLPAFEPLSSSPPVDLPRPAKRRALSPVHPAAAAITAASARAKYPTPFPTSATGIGSSPPRRAPVKFTTSRPSLALSQSAGNAGPEQRAPLSTVPCIELPENGEEILMGRSSHSSHYQLSANRLISRVHLKARYIPSPAPLSPARVEIVCTGCNGLKLHSQGRTWELMRGDSFTSETEGTDLFIDAQDARVMVQWPRRSDKLATMPDDSPWEDSPCQPTSAQRSARCLGQSSPLRRSLGGRACSPASPTPANVVSSSRRLQSLMPAVNEHVEIYEDEIYEDEEAAGVVAEDKETKGREDDDDDDDAQPELPPQIDLPSVDLDAGMSTVMNSFSSDYNDPEENDPIVHSFGPFGPNINARMGSITATSPRPTGRRRRLASVSRDIKSSVRATADDNADGIDAVVAAPAIARSSPPAKSPSPAPATPSFDTTAIINHAINQLAYSRLASTPLSTILANLPAEQKRNGELSKDTLRPIIENVECVGTIERQGKDAAGKPLESEYYYLPEKDEDEERRLAVTHELGRTSLRNCRKQHKQYYWKPPPRAP